jgi:hypothetical protein
MDIDASVIGHEADLFNGEKKTQDEDLVEVLKKITLLF